MTNQEAPEPHKKPVAWSAGIVGLDLTPQEEKVALVLNIASKEVQLVPAKVAKRRREYKDRIVSDNGDGNLIVEFDQPDGYGTPFGKVEDEDEGDSVKTALRETLEESGMDLSSRVTPTISHREKPHEWSPYFNIVFLGNCVGVEFKNELIRDEFVNKNRSGFFRLYALPFRQKPKPKKGGKTDSQKIYAKPKPGPYQAAIRRIIAILLQLDRPMLAQLGRPDSDHAEDLVKMVLARVRYFNLFSQRMLKMLVGLKREDIIMERLKHDKGVIQEPRLAGHIGANIVLWLPKICLDEGLDALLARCDPSLRLPSRKDNRHFVNMEVFLGECLQRRNSTIETYEDKHAEVPDEKTIVEEEDEFAPPEDHIPSFARMWLDAEAKEAAWKVKKQAAARPPDK